MNSPHKKLPHPALLPFVKEYWFLHSAKGLSMPLSIAPPPEQCLYFYPKNLPTLQTLDGRSIKSANTLVVGQLVSRVNLQVPDHYLMFKIIFQPGGFFRLFGTPMTLFANQSQESIAVLGNGLDQLREQVTNADGFEQMVRLSDAFLGQKAAHRIIQKQPIDAVINQANVYQFSLGQLAHDACLSPRQFERKFLERIGISPKLYQRIVRFNQAMKLKKHAPDQNWLTITYASGYFDQMHLLRDFRAFTGEIPSGFDFKNAIIY